MPKHATQSQLAQELEQTFRDTEALLGVSIAVHDDFRRVSVSFEFRLINGSDEIAHESLPLEEAIEVEPRLQEMIDKALAGPVVIRDFFIEVRLFEVDEIVNALHSA